MTTIQITDETWEILSRMKIENKELKTFNDVIEYLLKKAYIEDLNTHTRLTEYLLKREQNHG